MQRRNDPTRTVPHQTRLTRCHSLGDGHERPQPAPKLLQETLSKQGQKVPQQISVHNLQLVESSETERDAESDPIICTVLPPYTVSPGSGTPLAQPLDQDSDVLQHFSNGKYQQIERAQHPPFGDAHGHIDAHTALGREGSRVAQNLTAQKLHTQTMLPTSHWKVTSSDQTGILHTKKGILKQPLYREPFALRFHPEGGSFTQQHKGEFGCCKGLSYTQVAYTAKNTPAQYTAENTPTHYGEFTAQECGRIAEFLAHCYPWTEPRHELLLTLLGKEQHLLLHNNTCSHLTMMLEVLLPATLRTAERDKLDLLCKISQQNMLHTWPGDWLQSTVTTPGFEGPLSEIAELETRQLGFLNNIKETLLEVYDTLSNPRGTTTATYTPRLTHFLDLKPALTWIQFVLPEDFTHPPLQLAALHETYGPLGEITEIFLFKPRPEGFIIFNGNLHIPNIDGIMAPQHFWIGIHNPQQSSAPICTATSPHYPTRRPGIGSFVTLATRSHCGSH